METFKKYTKYSHTGKVLAEKESGSCFRHFKTFTDQFINTKYYSAKDNLRRNYHFDDLQNGKLKLSDGTEIDADIAVISDGSRSRIRKHIFKDEMMRVVRESEVVNIIQNKEIANSIENDFMKFHHEDGGLTFGILKLSDDTVLWYSQFDN